MANELRLTATFSYEKGDASIDEQVSNLGVDVTGSVVAAGVQEIGTSEEALGLNGVTTGGYLFIKNLDDTNYVSIRSGTGATDLVRLKAGEFAIFRVDSSSSAPFAIANTAAVNVRYVLLSD